MDRKILSMVAIAAIAVCLASVMFVMPALTQPIAEQSKTITDIKAGVPMTIEMPDVHGGVEKDDEVGVTNILMTFNRDLDKADIYGSLYLTKPDDWPAAPGDYVVYTERTLVSPALTTLATVEYNLRVSKESLARENIDKNTLVEYRKAEIAGKWMPQETHIVNEDDKYVYLYSKVVLFPHTHYATGGFHP